MPAEHNWLLSSPSPKKGLKSVEIPPLMIQEALARLMEFARRSIIQCLAKKPSTPNKTVVPIEDESQSRKVMT
jgi:hypothetical protein